MRPLELVWDARAFWQVSLSGMCNVLQTTMEDRQIPTVSPFHPGLCTLTAFLADAVPLSGGPLRVHNRGSQTLYSTLYTDMTAVGPARVIS